MNKFFTIAASILLLCSFAKGQSNALQLAEFEKLADCSTFSQFDTEARRLGFSYSSRSKNVKYTEYEYEKRVETYSREGKIYLSYLDYGDGKPIIYYAGGSSFLYSQISIIKTQTQYSKTKYFESSDCNSSDPNAIVFCYLNSQYSLKLKDSPEKGKDYSLIEVKIFKRS